MGAGHGHVPTAGHAGAAHRWRLRVAFVLVASFFVVELVVGLVAGSLALVSDAGHMAADVVALGRGPRRHPDRRPARHLRGAAPSAPTGPRSSPPAWRCSSCSASRCSSSSRRWGGSAGSRRSPAGRCSSSAGSASSSTSSPSPCSAAVRRRASTSRAPTSRWSRTPSGPSGSSSPGALVMATGVALWDTVVALAIAAFVAVRAVLLGREVLAVLAQHAPAGIHPDEAEAVLRRVADVVDVHDLHLWTLTSGMHVATAHLVCRDGADPARVLAEASAQLRRRWSIDHATLQVEPRGSRSCVETGWWAGRGRVRRPGSRRRRGRARCAGCRPSTSRASGRGR